MHERHEGIPFLRLRRDDRVGLDVFLPGDSGEGAPTLRGLASERGALAELHRADIVRFRAWKAVALLRRFKTRTATRVIGRLRTTLPLGVWDARSGRSGNDRTLSEGKAGSDGAQGAKARVDASDARVVF